ncbi:MAG: efflux RND transporter permease subunit [Spirochaetia bacterium]|jgi:predicted RND superfamily exporter protein|uniref:Mmpl family n=2 Tax=root TaxID=1 RepID=A0A652ZRT3_9SPIR|nr:efflux RND transporter permease subunit [Spirochaetia bacterium]MCE1209147.1 efflux RND transporter permease subunit [Spirochaetia bacterium]MDD3821179.1 efflux RND transporter permease subunit [Spirochaetales bacterium]VBB38474.1 Mmpl family [uncultured Spirochaetota bacterium]HOI23250.1 efflux RND transporter permease subunit [Spirochaetales bacterium]
MEKLFRHPRWIVVIVSIITVFFALQIPKATLDNNNFRFVPDNDPELLGMKSVNESFGSQLFILVGLERKHGTVLDAEFIGKLRDFSAKLSEIPIVASITSLSSTDYLTGRGDSIIAEPLVPESYSGSRREIAELKERILSWDLYKGSLVSEDFSSTQVLVYLGTSAEDAGSPEVVAVHRSIKRIAGEVGFPDTRLYITGMPVFSSVVNDAMEEDLVVLIPLVVFVVILVLFLSFRRFSGVVLPLLTVLVSSIWAIGAMALLGVKLSILSTVLPVILVAVGSAYGIHVVSHYYDELAEKKTLNQEEHRALVLAVLKRIGNPVLLAALTTLAGFISLSFSKVAPIFEFGIFASFGVLVAFVVSLTLVPAIMIIRGPASKLPRFRITEMKPGQEDPLSGAIADALGHVSTKKRSILALGLLVILVSVFSLGRLVIDNVLVEYFKPDTDVVLSDRFIRDKFGGSKSVSLVLSSEEPGGVLRPDVLGAMDGLATYLRTSVPEVGKTTGFTDMIKRVNQVFNVDESPDGLKPRAEELSPRSGEGSSDDGLPSFGFGAVEESQAGSGDETLPAFGFSDFGAPAPESKGFAQGTEESRVAGSVPTGTSGETLSDAIDNLDKLALVALLDKALTESDGETRSAADLVENLARLTNYKGRAYYEIPTDPARYGKKTDEELRLLISNYLVLLSGDISDFADDPLEPTSIRMQIQLKTVGQIDTNRAVAAIRAYIDERFPKDIEARIAGDALVEGSLNRLVVESQLSSVAISLLMVFIILSVFYRSAVAGLIGLVPLSITILVNFAVMALAGIKLNIGTAMVSSIAVGTGIDYTIHYMAAFHHEYLATENKNKFLRRTFLTSGKAILFNAVSVGAGFAVLALSQFNILAELGILIALAMGTSSLVSLTLLPVLLMVTNPAFIRRPLPSDRKMETLEAGK